MSLALHNIKTKKQASKIRRGRGNSSGYGNYSGKGIKGQKCRSGVSGLLRIGMKYGLLVQTPKLRGFKSSKPKNAPINLKNINENFKEGDVINPEALVEKGFIKKATVPVKILGEGELQLKDLKFEGVAVSTGAREQIEKMKGAIK
jgi:large subunit ribosomal protein L15